MERYHQQDFFPLQKLYPNLEPDPGDHGLAMQE
jgi:hypothetical protein